MPSSCLALVRCPTEGIALLTGAIVNEPRPRPEKVHPRNLSTAIVFAYEAAVGLEPVEACSVLVAYFPYPLIAHSAEWPRPARSRLGRTDCRLPAHAWRMSPWAEDGGPQMRRG